MMTRGLACTVLLSSCEDLFPFCRFGLAPLRRRPFPAAHGLSVDEHVAAVKIGAAEVVELMDPHAVVERLLGRPVGLAIPAGEILHVVEVRHVRLSSGVHELVVERQRGVKRVDKLVAL